MLPAISPKASSIWVSTSPSETYRSRPSIRTRTPRCRPAERLQPPSPGVRKDAANGAAAAGPSRGDEQATMKKLIVFDSDGTLVDSQATTIPARYARVLYPGPLTPHHPLNTP